MKSFNDALLRIFQVLSQNPKLPLYKNGAVEITTSSNRQLLSITENTIKSPDPELWQKLTQRKSALPDQLLNLAALNNFIQKMTVKEALVRLNHIGFCYQVTDQEEEKQHLINVAHTADLHLYEEQSDSDDRWLFMGDIQTNWQDPLLEFILIKNSADKWIEYWLPHIQIDLDTTLTDTQLMDLIHKVLPEGQPLRIVIIDGVTYIVRLRLGIASGININLDLATKYRKVQYHREHILKATT